MANNNAGDVEYILRADDSNVESDIKKANEKVEKAVKKAADKSVEIEEKKTQGIKKESDKVVKNTEKAASDMVEAWEDAGQDVVQAIEKIDDVTPEITIKADTSKAEKEIKAISKDKNVDIDVNADVSAAKEGIENLGETAEGVGEKIKDALGGEEGASLFENLGNVLKSSFTDAANSSIPLVSKVGELASGLSGAQVAAIGAGAAAAGIGVLAVGAAMDIDSAMNQLVATTGATAEESEKYRQVMEDIYNNNYGENFEDIGNAIADVRKNLGDLNAESLQNVTESAFALRDVFGYDIPETTRAAKAMMDNFGISGEEAMNLIAAGAQNGLDYSGELIDSINEYSVQFAKVGFDANDMFKIFQKGAESGAFNLDKIGDAVKEMAIRVVDGSDSTKAAFESIGLDADEMANKFAAGGESAKEAFEQTVEALATLEEPLAQNEAGIALFGTMWEDLGADAVTALADIGDEAYSTGEELNTLKEVKYDDLCSQFEQLKRNVETAIIPIGEALLPLMKDLGETVLPLVSECLAPLISLFAELISPIIGIISSAIMPLISAFVDLINLAIMPVIEAIGSLFLPLVTGYMNSISGTISSVIGNVRNIFTNLIDFIKNIFTGNWKAAWENIKNIFKNIVSGFATIWKSPINAIIDGINSFTGSLAKIKIPDWVPAVGGKSIKIPKIPRLKIGMDYVPRDNFPAFLDEGEWVLTKEEANLLRSFGGLEALVAKNSDSHSFYPVTAQGDKMDYELMGKVFSQGNRENNDLMRQEILLLQRQNELLVELLEKESGISPDDIFNSVKRSADDYTRRTGEPAFY